MNTANLIDAPFLAEDAAHLIKQAAAVQGPKAFENPRSSTTFHEAGHAVVYTAFGHEVRRVKIWRKKRVFARGQWVGHTAVKVALGTGPDTLPEDDFAFACILIAGVLSEQMFDTANFRAGSSIDEVATTRALASNIALKTAADFTEIMIDIFRATGGILRNNADVVRAVAADLDRYEVVCRKRLAPTLRRVVRQADER